MNPIIQENQRRVEQARAASAFDPAKGDPNDPARVAMNISWELGEVYLPQTMVDDPEFRRIKSLLDYKRLRIHHDFPYWCYLCGTIRHKTTGQIVPLTLNTPQRRVAELLEADRLAGRPIRLIMLKARQWGGSTLVQMYFSWIQIEHKRNWNSLICAHVKDTAAAIRAMFDGLLSNYPEELWPEDMPPKFVPWQRSSNTLEIQGRGAKVTLSSSFGQNAVRGLDFSMAHLSEVAFWNDTNRMSPGDFMRSVCGGIPTVPYSMIVMESTANGVSNFFHQEWARAEEGNSAYRPIFVPWYEIDIYQSEVTDPEGLAASFNDYEAQLWQKGLTLEQIQWYRQKRSDMLADDAMFAEFPTTPDEAFIHTGSAVFNGPDIDRLRQGCTEPLKLTREMLPDDLRPILDLPAGDGELKVWRLPVRIPPIHRNRYVIAVDVGGRSRKSDYSVICVFDRMPSGEYRPDGKMEVVAQWRGHCDHDLLAGYAARLGAAYHKALLIIESNTLESAGEGASQYILERLNSKYRNLYRRVSRDRAGMPVAEPRVGFHTNHATKGAAITTLIEMVRGEKYVERDSDLCDELANYELTESGSYAARNGFHDDLLMTRAIGLYVISSMPQPVSAVDPPNHDVRSLYPPQYNPQNRVIY